MIRIFVTLFGILVGSALAYLFVTLDREDFSVPSRAGEASVAPAAEAHDDEEEDFLAARQTGSFEGWEAFLTRHPDGPYAKFAEAEARKDWDRRRAPAPPAGAAPAAQMVSDGGRAVPPPTAPSAVEEICKDDEDRLGQLRATLAPEAILKFAGELRCERLRPQLVALAAAAAVADTRRAGAASETRAADAPPTTQGSPPAPPPSADVACKQDEGRLAPPRPGPSSAEALNFAEDMRCGMERLQVQAPAAAPVVAGAPRAGAAPEADSADATIPPPAPPDPDAVCKRDEERLVRLRANPSGEEAVKFAAELRCEKLAPQVEALIQALDVATMPPAGAASGTVGADRTTAQASPPVPPASEPERADRTTAEASPPVPPASEPERADRTTAEASPPVPPASEPERADRTTAEASPPVPPASAPERADRTTAEASPPVPPASEPERADRTTAEASPPVPPASEPERADRTTAEASPPVPPASEPERADRTTAQASPPVPPASAPERADRTTAEASPPVPPASEPERADRTTAQASPPVPPASEPERADRTTAQASPPVPPSPVPSTSPAAAGERVARDEVRASGGTEDATAAADACRRDEQSLAELRRNPSRQSIAQYARALRCDRLWPQFSRLVDSLDDMTAQTASAQTASAPRSPASEGAAGGPAGACAADQDSLNRVRMQPTPDAVQDLWRDLRCERLRPQVRLLLESLDLKSDPSGACRREAGELNRIRSNPDRRAAEDFARDVQCDVLKPQVARLLESLRE